MLVELEHSAARVIKIIHSTAISLANEKDAQAELFTALTNCGLLPGREVRLSPRDIVDFLLPCGLAIEVKLHGPKRAVFAQLERYASHEGVRGLLLATNLSMGLPAEIGGRPAWCASLGRGWI